MSSCIPLNFSKASLAGWHIKLDVASRLFVLGLFDRGNLLESSNTKVSYIVVLLFFFFLSIDVRDRQIKVPFPVSLFCLSPPPPFSVVANGIALQSMMGEVLQGT